MKCSVGRDLFTISYQFPTTITITLAPLLLIYCIFKCFSFVVNGHMKARSGVVLCVSVSKCFLPVFSLLQLLLESKQPQYDALRKGFLSHYRELIYLNSAADLFLHSMSWELFVSL